MEYIWWWIWCALKHNPNQVLNSILVTLNRGKENILTLEKKNDTWNACFRESISVLCLVDAHVRFFKRLRFGLVCLAIRLVIQHQAMSEYFKGLFAAHQSQPKSVLSLAAAAAAFILSPSFCTWEVNIWQLTLPYFHPDRGINKFSV